MLNDLMEQRLLQDVRLYSEFNNHTKSLEEEAFFQNLDIKGNSIAAVASELSKEFKIRADMIKHTAEDSYKLYETLQKELDILQLIEYKDMTIIVLIGALKRQALVFDFREYDDVPLEKIQNLGITVNTNTGCAELLRHQSLSLEYHIIAAYNVIRRARELDLFNSPYFLYTIMNLTVDKFIEELEKYINLL